MADRPLTQWKETALTALGPEDVEDGDESQPVETDERESEPTVGDD